MGEETWGSSVSQCRQRSGCGAHSAGRALGVTITEDGKLDGYLTAFKKAGALGYSREGSDHSLYEHADDYPDLETGKGSPIFTQYLIRRIPVFLIDQAGP